MDKSKVHYQPNELKTKYGHIFAAYFNMARHNVFLIAHEIADKLGQSDSKFEDDGQLLNAWAFKALTQKGIAPELRKSVMELWQHYLPYLAAETEAVRVQALLEQALRQLKLQRNTFTHYIYYREFDLNSTAARAKRQLFKNINQVLEIRDKRQDENAEKALGYRGFERDSLKTLEGLESPVRNEYNSQLSVWDLAFFLSLFLEKKYGVQLWQKLGLTQLAFEHGNNEEQQKLLAEWFWQFSCRLPRPKLESSDIFLDMINELGRCPMSVYRHLSEVDAAKFFMNEHLQLDKEGNEFSVPTIMRRHKDRFPYFVLRYFDDQKIFEQMRFQIQLGKELVDVYEKQDFGKRRIYRDLRTFGRIGHFSENNAPDDWKLAAWQTEYSSNHDKGKMWKDEEVSTAPDWMNRKIKQFAPSYRITGNRIGLKFFDNNYKIALNNLAKENFFSPEKETSLWLPLEKYEELTGTNSAKIFQPDAILSTFELPGLYLYQHLFQKGWLTESAEVFIQNYIQRFSKFCQKVKGYDIKPVGYETFEIKNKGGKTEEKDFVKESFMPGEFVRNDRDYEKELTKRRKAVQQILDKYQLKIKDLPDTLRDYLMGFGAGSYFKKLSKKLEAKIRETENLRKRIQREFDWKDRQAYGTKWRIKNGDLATWLARDMIFFLPADEATEHKGKPNNQQYNRLQSLIAYFARDKEELLEFLETLNLVGTNWSKLENGHPFLYQVNVDFCRGVKTFYEAYLIQKNAYLKDLKQAADKNKKLTGQTFFLSESGNGGVKDYKSVPAFLPRGLFNEAIFEALKKNEIAIEKQFDEKQKVKFITIQACLDAYQKQELQPLYDLDRFYSESILVDSAAENGAENRQQLRRKWDDDFKDKLRAAFQEIKEERKNWQEKQKKKKGKKGEEQFSKVKFSKMMALKKLRQKGMSNEAKIRYTQLTDKVLMLIIKYLAGARQESLAIENWGDRLKLSNIGYPTDAAGKNNLLNEEVRMSINLGEQTVFDNLPIKFYGDFRRFFKDRRLKNLLEYYNNSDPIHRLNLEGELLYYDLKRTEIFDKILEFEKVFHENYFEAFEKERGYKNYLGHKEQLAILSGESPKILPKSQINALKDFRNKYCHNEIPLSEDLKNKVDLPDFYFEKKTEPNSLDILVEKNIPKYHGKEITKQITEKVLEAYQNLIQKIQG